MVRMSNEHGTPQILSLNLDHGVLAEALLEYIRDEARDVSIFCFQESDDDIRHAIDHVLGEDFESYHAAKPVTGEVISLATYVRKGIVVEDVTTMFETGADIGMAMCCSLRVVDGARFVVTNVHGYMKPGHKLDTPERLRLTRELIARGRDSADPQIVIGDFNLLPETQSVQEFAKNGYRDLIDEFKIPTTRNERAWRKYPDTPQMHADYAFVRGEGMTYDFAVDDVVVSDHLPLILEVTFK